MNTTQDNIEKADAGQNSAMMICPKGSRMPKVGEVCAAYPHNGPANGRGGGETIRYVSGSAWAEGVTFLADERGLVRVA